MRFHNHLKKIAVMAVAAISLTSCHSYLSDWEAIPEEDVVQIPQEGGIYDFTEFELEYAGTTRVINREHTYKCYRYRLNVGDNIGMSEHDSEPYITFEVPANETGAERDVTLEISKAKDFHLAQGTHDKADLSEESWEEWQTVWRGVQER